MFPCLIVCKASCGARGCLEGTMDQCCHEECLGGCTVKGSKHHCHACMHYRSGPYGFCVSKCPLGMYVVSGDSKCSAGRISKKEQIWDRILGGLFLLKSFIKIPGELEKVPTFENS